MEDKYIDFFYANCPQKLLSSAPEGSNPRIFVEHLVSMERRKKHKTLLHFEKMVGVYFSELPHHKYESLFREFSLPAPSLSSLDKVFKESMNPLSFLLKHIHEIEGKLILSYCLDNFQRSYWTKKTVFQKMLPIMHDSAVKIVPVVERFSYEIL